MTYRTSAADTHPGQGSQSRPGDYERLCRYRIPSSWAAEKWTGCWAHSRTLPVEAALALWGEGVRRGRIYHSVLSKTTGKFTSGNVHNISTLMIYLTAKISNSRLLSKINFYTISRSYTNTLISSMLLWFYFNAPSEDPEEEWSNQRRVLGRRWHVPCTTREQRTFRNPGKSRCQRISQWCYIQALKDENKIYNYVHDALH